MHTNRKLRNSDTAKNLCCYQYYLCVVVVPIGWYTAQIGISSAFQIDTNVFLALQSIVSES